MVEAGPESAFYAVIDGRRPDGTTAASPKLCNHHFFNTAMMHQKALASGQSQISASHPAGKGNEWLNWAWSDKLCRKTPERADQDSGDIQISLEVS